MAQQLITTPFGRRSLSFGQMTAQMTAREVTPESIVHKWKVLQAITTAKDKIGVPDRAIAVLNALLSFHPDTTLSAGDPLIVFPSNEKLAARSHGVAPATLRRHLAILVERGIIIRRDSPNGKRYARRGQGGEVALAFGFDLTPLVARFDEFEALAAQTEAEKRGLRLARERVTLARRDVTKMIAFGLEQALGGPWSDWHTLYLAQVSRIKRFDLASDFTAIAVEMEQLARDIANHLETFINSQNTSANESHSEQHKQNSKHNTTEFELAPEGTKAKSLEPSETTTATGTTGQGQTATASRTETKFTLGMVLDACPDIHDYAFAPKGQGRKDGLFQPGEASRVSDWASFLKAAELVRAMLGISPDAWRDATQTMGEVEASICVAAILQKGDEIKFPGGYLRALTEKKRGGKFSTGPILMALIGSKLKKRAET